jgi:hypothetical protein
MTAISSTPSLPEPILAYSDDAAPGMLLDVILRWIPVGMATYGVWETRQNCGHFFGGVYWYGQETAMPALTIATALAAKPDDAKIAGFERTELERVVVSAIRYLCFTHDTGPADCIRPAVGIGRPEPASTKWGEAGIGFFRESQCGVTIANLAATAILMRERLGEEERHMLAAIATDYLDRFCETEPKSGVFFDTQTEENAWTALGLAAASLLLHDDTRFEQWQEQVRLWAFCAVTTPSDRHDQRIFEKEKSIRELTGKVCTTLPDGTAENHGMVHPSYMSSSISLLGNLMVLYRLWGKKIPNHARHRLHETYDLIKKWCDSNGIPQAPQGMDWPYFSLTAHCALHAFANVELEDPDGALMEQRIMNVLHASSVAHGGRLIPEATAKWCHGQQDPAIMGEKGIASIAYAYLAHRLAGPGQTPTHPAEFENRIAGVHLYHHGGIAIHNHGRGRTAFSWRNHTMILPAPAEGMRLIGPQFGSLCAQTSIKDTADTSILRGLKIREERDQICALLIEDIAEEKLRRQLFFASMEDGRAIVWERVTALEKVQIEKIQQGNLCIINDGLFSDQPDLRSHRTLWWPDGNRKFEGYPDGDDVPDENMELHPSTSTSQRTQSIASPDRKFSWVNIDDRFTIAYTASGAARYEDPHHFPVWHAIKNNLILSAHDAPSLAEKTDVVCEMLISWIPDHEHGKAIEAVPDVGVWDATHIELQTGSWRVECHLPDPSDARAAKISIARK